MQYEGPLCVRLPIRTKTIDPEGTFSFEIPLPDPSSQVRHTGSHCCRHCFACLAAVAVQPSRVTKLRAWTDCLTLGGLHPASCQIGWCERRVFLAAVEHVILAESVLH